MREWNRPSPLPSEICQKACYYHKINKEMINFSMSLSYFVTPYNRTLSGIPSMKGKEIEWRGPAICQFLKIEFLLEI